MFWVQTYSLQKFICYYSTHNIWFQIFQTAELHNFPKDIDYDYAFHFSFILFLCCGLHMDTLSLTKYKLNSTMIQYTVNFSRKDWIRKNNNSQHISMYCYVRWRLRTVEMDPYPMAKSLIIGPALKSLRPRTKGTHQGKK